jgi:hypothetical protein
MAQRMRQELPEIRYMLDQLPTVARQLLNRLNEGDPQRAARPRDYYRQAMLRRARHRYLAFSGALAAVVAALLIGQQAQPGWLGWGLGAAAVALLVAGRPRG